MNICMSMNSSKLLFHKEYSTINIRICDISVLKLIHGVSIFIINSVYIIF